MTDLLHRRNFLSDFGTGLGGVALAWLLQNESHGASPNATSESPATVKPVHFPAKAKRAIQIFCAGGVSHVDTFDYKPDLIKHHGQELTGKGKIDTFFGRPGRLMRSPYRFQKRGK